MSAYKAVAVDFVFSKDVVIGHIWIWLEWVASPFCVVPVIAIPVFCSVAWIECECCPAAVFAILIVGNAVCYILFTVDGCCVGQEYIAIVC